MHNQGAIKKILDQGMVTRSIIETEVSMRKCQMFSQMAQDKEVKTFFQKQAAELGDLGEFLKSKLAEVM